MDRQNTKYRPVSFLTEAENRVMFHLIAAMDLFEMICEKDPQDPSDTYNFGHYLDAAKSAVIMRGARRMDPETLIIHKRKATEFKRRGTQQDPKMWDAAVKRMNELFGEDPLEAVTEPELDGGESDESPEGN